MEPLRITFRLQNGFVAPAYPIHLDSILAYAVTQRQILDLEEEPTRDALRTLGKNLPLETFEKDGESVWKASALLMIGRVRHNAGFFTKRTDPEELATLLAAGKVSLGHYKPGKKLKPYEMLLDTNRGFHRNLLGFYPIIECDVLEAWCIGDRDRIEEIFDYGYISHIGARRRSGHGCIKSIKIEIDDDAMEFWKVRVRPWPMLEDDEPIQAAIQSPYWASENKRTAWCPTRII